VLRRQAPSPWLGCLRPPFPVLACALGSPGLVDARSSFILSHRGHRWRPLRHRSVHLAILACAPGRGVHSSRGSIIGDVAVGEHRLTRIEQRRLPCFWSLTRGFI